MNGSVLLFPPTALLTATLCAQGTQWLQVYPPRHPPSGAVMTFDEARREIVLFSAYRGSNHTWTFDGVNWIQKRPTASPPARDDPALAYDAVRERVVLFGGWDGTSVLADTWEWDGKNWTQLSTTSGPSARVHHAAAFDARRSRVVLFGGASGFRVGS